MKHYSFAKRLSLPQLRVPRTHTRIYHSDYHPPPPLFSKTEENILAAAISHVPTHGFSSKALALGVKQAGYLPVSIPLFPRGVFDLVYYHLATQRLELKNRLQFPEESKLGVDERVRALILERLGANKSIIHHWQSVRPIFYSISSRIMPLMPSQSRGSVTCR
jgi:ubiquinone biosynthesis protein COQ9